MRVPTLNELIFCTSDGKRTVAESMEAGEPLHIADAESGLACNCRCPSCGRRMVAHRGTRRQHFQHAADVHGETCASSGETALHKFAKKTLAAALQLRLPALKASDGRNTVEVVHEGEFYFDSAVLEKRHGEIVPDVVCHRAGRALHVEFMVTHACGPEKVERFREMDVGAIEVDLSGYRDQPLDNLVGAILSEAPRNWLHNPRISVARVKLDSMERERLAGIESSARDLLAEPTSVAPHADIGHWEKGAVEHDLGPLIEASVPSVGFRVREQEWRAFVLIQFGLVAKDGFTRKEAFSAIKEEGWVAQKFRFVDAEVADCLRRLSKKEVWIPWEALGDFLGSMRKSGMLVAVDQREKLAGGRKLFETIRRAQELRERPAKRTEELKALVTRILAPVREGFKAGFDFDQWFASADVLGERPADFLNVEDDDWMGFISRLERLCSEMRRRPPTITEPLGLPVQEEASARQASHRLAHERQKQEAEEKVEREASERATNLRRYVETAMGAAAVGWLDTPQDVLDGLSPSAIARRSQSDFWRATKALDRWRDTLREAEQRQTKRENALASLRSAARTEFKREDIVDLWLRQPHQKLNGAKPGEYCIDDSTLRACLDLFTGRRRR
jgi:hypothetical protein